MNKNATPIILIVLALGIYFTFTSGKLDELKSIKDVNIQYQKVLDDSDNLVGLINKVSKTYNDIDPADKQNLDKILPDNIDNVRVIIDINEIAKKHGVIVKSVATGKSDSTATDANSPDSARATYDSASLNYSVLASYQSFVDFIKELEESMRIIDISRISLSATDAGAYTYDLEIKTYWLKQK